MKRRRNPQSTTSVTTEQRTEFWNRVYRAVDAFREEHPLCDVAVNCFENRRWSLRFTQASAQTPTTLVLTVHEHDRSKQQLLLAVTLSSRTDDSIVDAETRLIPVLFDAASDRFLLHADHGSVTDNDIPVYFARLIGMLCERL